MAEGAEINARKLHSEMASYIPNMRNLHDIGTCKPLAKFGDLITNLVYSIAISKLQNRLDQNKVSKKILSNALKHSDMKEYTWKRADAHDMADSVESFIGYMYLKYDWSVYLMADILLQIMASFNLQDYRDEVEVSILGFSGLLVRIRERLKDDFPK